MYYFEGNNNEIFIVTGEKTRIKINEEEKTLKELDNLNNKIEESKEQIKQAAKILEKVIEGLYEASNKK